MSADRGSRAETPNRPPRLPCSQGDLAGDLGACEARRAVRERAADGIGATEGCHRARLPLIDPTRAGHVGQSSHRGHLHGQRRGNVRRPMAGLRPAPSSGVDKPSAVKLATRNNWRRRKANTGQMQVLVPIHWFERSQGKRDRYTDKSVEMSADLSAFDAALQAVTEAKDSEIATLREAFEVMLTAKDGEIVSLRQQWERAMAYLDSRAQPRRRAARAPGPARRQAHRRPGRACDRPGSGRGGQRTAEAAQIAQGEAEADAAELRQAEAERRARGVLARLRAAWRGE